MTIAAENTTFGYPEGKAGVSQIPPQYNSGQDAKDLNGAVEFWKASTTKAGAKMNVYRWTPFYADTQFDLVYMGVHDDLEAFAATTAAAITSPDSASIGMA